MGREMGRETGRWNYGQIKHISAVVMVKDDYRN